MQTAIVTGGNRGIGLEICRQLAAQGVRVLLTARDSAKAEAAAKNLPGEIVAHPLDVTNGASVDALNAFVINEYGVAEILINNAAILLDDDVDVLSVDIETMREVVETNVYGPLRMCEAFIPLMKSRGYGRVVNVSSEAGSLTNMTNYAPSYSMSKAALNALTRMIADSLRGYKNIKVNAACPGWVRTDMGGSNAPRSVEQGATSIIQLATLPENGVSGGFFRDGKPLAW